MLLVDLLINIYYSIRFIITELRSETPSNVVFYFKTLSTISRHYIPLFTKLIALSYFIIYLKQKPIF